MASIEEDWFVLGVAVVVDDVDVDVVASVIVAPVVLIFALNANKPFPGVIGCYVILIVEYHLFDFNFCFHLLNLNCSLQIMLLFVHLLNLLPSEIF